jgi:hypothetical protein
MPGDIGLIAAFLASDEARWKSSLGVECSIEYNGAVLARRSFPARERERGGGRRHQWNLSTEGVAGLV